MPNYKDCRMCPDKFVPIGDERICPNCEADIQRAVSMPAGQPIVVGTISDATAIAMRKAVENALPEPEVIELIEDGIVSEEVAKAIEPKQEQALPLPETQVEKDIVVVEEAIVELNKGEDAEIIKEEIVAPTAPKSDVPEEKPDAPG